MGQIPALPREVTKSNLQKLAWKKYSSQRGRENTTTLALPSQGGKVISAFFRMSTNRAQLTISSEYFAERQFEFSFCCDLREFREWQFLLHDLCITLLSDFEVKTHPCPI